MMKTLTRLLSSLAVTFCLFLQTVTAQNIPDPNFADAIRADCPPCIDANNNLLPPAQTLGSLDVPAADISDLTGIGGFLSLTYLDCSYNQLTSLPALPNSLTGLICYFNQLTSLPALPNSLTGLTCYGNQLTSLPALPNSLTYLRCDANQLTSLPALPNSLTILYCDANQLTSLPALPNSLTELNCYANQLTSLPALPNSLSYLFCFDNQLTSLPALPNSLFDFDCGTNQLTSLPALPNSLTYLRCNDNPSLFCLPLLPSGLVLLFTSGTQITCIPNQPLNLNMDPVLPLCSEPCDSSVFTSNILAAKPFSVQPNPVSEVLQVRFSADYEGNADFRLFNSNGQIVCALSAKGDVEIPVGDLPQGVYWLEVRGTDWVFGEKILKK